MILFKKWILSTLVWLGGIAFGGGVLWTVVELSGPQRIEVVVHVADVPAVVTIDDESFTVDSTRDTPIVRELSRGRHRLRMMVGDRLVYEEDFQVLPDREVVLTAWDPRRAANAQASVAVGPPRESDRLLREGGGEIEEAETHR